MYSHILFPTDGSDCADAALDHAIEHARTYDATLVVLYVADVREVGYAAPALSLERVREALLESGEQVVDRVAQAAREAGVEVETVVTEGTPASEIIRHADEREVDLVVMGTHGRSGIDRYLIGSVAERVVRGSDAPVLTVRQESS
ncbi:universal stress protein [Haloferax volcanii]|uniref:Universal stress protein n=2 Tax=Haloferax volcanii TaxID=2246 RepID=A0A558GDY0_HALVO|nr:MULTISPECIES: universal stress protein [Haloferax]ELZ93506.1 UspA domain-containing protein [Haloferax alexandrinus JCM 10717]NLV02115.1 universal stress protein [Haloferax alexandrinus]TVT95978.1 universal stress protein [Haloferax volcanii]